MSPVKVNMKLASFSKFLKEAKNSGNIKNKYNNFFFKVNQCGQAPPPNKKINLKIQLRLNLMTFHYKASIS